MVASATQDSTQDSTLKLVLLGAGGKMGCRITDNIKDLDRYEASYVEVSREGRERLAERGLRVREAAEVLPRADVVILAVPDRLIGTISHQVVPQLRPGAMLLGLDPAAAHAGVMLMRDDLSYFVTHPCHPPVFNDEVTPEARTDWFGGIHAKQNIVCALHQGPESDYAKGEAIARDIYAPVMRAHRVTVEQMAILEPALAETFAATLVTAMKEAMEEAVRMGVPEEAAKDFLFGHIRIELAIVFGFAGFPFSDGAKLAVREAYDKIFKPDWKANIMNLDALERSVQQITSG